MNRTIKIRALFLVGLMTANGMAEVKNGSAEILSRDGPAIVQFLQGCRPGGLAEGTWVMDTTDDPDARTFKVKTMKIDANGAKVQREDRVRIVGKKIRYKSTLVRPEGFWELSGNRKIALFSIPGGGGFGPEVSRLQTEIKELIMDGYNGTYLMEKLELDGANYIRITQEMSDETTSKIERIVELIVRDTNSELQLSRLPASMRRRLPKVENLVPVRMVYLVREADQVVTSTRSFNRKGSVVNEQLEEDVSEYVRVDGLPDGWFDVPANAEERYPKGMFEYTKAATSMYKEECFVSFEEFSNPFFMVRDGKLIVKIDRDNEKK